MTDTIWRRYDQKCVLRAGKNGRRRETMLKRFPEFFFGWIRKVFTSLDQRNLFCLDRINDNRSAACPIPPKTAKNGKNGHNGPYAIQSRDTYLELEPSLSLA